MRLEMRCGVCVWYVVSFYEHVFIPHPRGGSVHLLGVAGVCTYIFRETAWCGDLGPILNLDPALFWCVT